MADEDLVSLLYGELEPDEAARTSARVADDPTLSARFGEMRRVRELFAAMAEDEPPPAGSPPSSWPRRRAPRRSASARRLRGRKPDDGLDFFPGFSLLAQRPALAAAASLVLVAGVAGVLY